MRSAASMMAMLATAYHSHRAPAPLALKTCWTGTSSTGPLRPSRSPAAPCGLFFGKPRTLPQDLLPLERAR